MFHLGATSEGHLVGLDQRLVRCVRRAIVLTTVDFAVVDGLRTAEEQAELVREGASKKLDSLHLDGLAVDLCPFVAGKLRWKWEPMKQVIIAMRESAVALTVPELVCGAVWDRKLVDLDPTKLDDELENYRDRYRAARGLKKTPLFDPWHFQVQ